MKELLVMPDFVAPALYTAAEWIMGKN